MEGLFYKDLRICKSDYLLMCVVHIMMAIGVIVFTVLSKADLYENVDVAQSLLLVKIMIFMLDFFFISMSSTVFTAKDEQKNWHLFINSVPDGKRRQVKSKYISILFMYMFSVSCILIIDTISVIICNDMSISAVGNIVLLFCGILIYEAIQLPFIVGFGGSKGQKIKGIFVLILFGAFAIYGLFGDISYFTSEDALAHIMNILKFIQNGYLFTILPYATAFIYWLSYRIALLVYSKEGKRYDE